MPVAAEDMISDDWVTKQAEQLAAEQERRYAERRQDLESRLLLDEEEVDRRVRELVARAESAALLTESADCLEEVNRVVMATRRLAGDAPDHEPVALAGHALTDEQRDALARVLKRCAELEGECVQHSIRNEISQLHSELVLADAPPERILSQVVSDHRALARHVDSTERKVGYCNATKEALEELAALEAQLPAQGSALKNAEELPSFEAKSIAVDSADYFAVQDRVALLREAVGLPFTFASGGTFPVGMDLLPAGQVSLRSRQPPTVPTAIVPYEDPLRDAADSREAPADSTSPGGLLESHTPPASLPPAQRTADTTADADGQPSLEEPFSAQDTAVSVEPSGLPQPVGHARRLPTGERVDLSSALSRQQAELARIDAAHQRYCRETAGVRGTVIQGPPPSRPAEAALPELSGTVAQPCVHGGLAADGSVLHEGVIPLSQAMDQDGWELPDIPPVRALQLLFSLPPLGELLGHVREGLHSGWNTAQRQSIASRACAADSDGNALHLSCHPASEATVGACFISSDVVRLSHLRKLREVIPGFAEKLHECGIDLFSILEQKRSALPEPGSAGWAIDLDHPCDNVTTIFVDGAPVGLAFDPKDTAGAGGAVDDEGDPACEVPYPVAEDIARACGARLPTWQEWEAAVRGPHGLWFPWGNDPRVPCIDTETAPGGSATRNYGTTLLRSFGWLRQSESPGGLLGLCRYGYEWNAADYDLGDATGGLAHRATTHVLRSACDLGVLLPRDRPCASHRSYTLPCAATYMLPHRQVHCAAFRLVYVPPQQGQVTVSPGRPPRMRFEDLYGEISLGSLGILLGVCGEAEANRKRIEGLLGPAEAFASGAGVSELWMWPGRGCAAEVDPLSGNRVTAVTVYDRAYNRPLWTRRFSGPIDSPAMRFPLTLDDMRRAWGDATTKHRGNCVFYRRRVSDWAWWQGGSVARGERLRPGRRFAADQPTVARVALATDGSVSAVTLSLV
eukprot:TRINITY_DN10487_c0_g1_i1.p1 TRINITY_DN10487_c0_g1~~TRINITY_DN10487_c0_g1_i1.p1  ORF type:complete len:1001 (+),score=240.73 TRINITY_DN10487_c0_g1_i1:85-3003(+)